MEKMWAPNLSINIFSSTYLVNLIVSFSNCLPDKGEGFVKQFSNAALLSISTVPAGWLGTFISMVGATKYTLNS